MGGIISCIAKTCTVELCFNEAYEQENPVNPELSRISANYASLNGENYAYLRRITVLPIPEQINTNLNSSINISVAHQLFENSPRPSITSMINYHQFMNNYSSRHCSFVSTSRSQSSNEI